MFNCPVLLQDAFDIIESFDDGVDYGILDDPNKMITPEVRRRGSVAENVCCLSIHKCRV